MGRTIEDWTNVNDDGKRLERILRSIDGAFKSEFKKKDIKSKNRAISYLPAFAALQGQKTQLIKMVFAFDKVLRAANKLNVDIDELARKGDSNSSLPARQRHHN